MDAPELPAKIKVGFRDFTLESPWDPVLSSDAEAFGQCHTREGIIKVCQRFGTRKAAHTLLHEIMHAVYWTYHIADDANEEATVSAMSQGVAATWRDNPSVFAWIDYHIREGT